MEDLFNYYYQTLDTIRNEILAEEYRLRAKMNTFEAELKHLTISLQKYSLIEFYHEEDSLKAKIRQMANSFDDFSIYLPSARITCKDMTKA